MIRRLAALCALAIVPASFAAVDYWPTCSSPQQSAPLQVIGNGASPQGPLAIAWNGKEYGVVWTDATSRDVHFQRVFADGTPAAPAVLISTGLFTTINAHVGVVWNGAGYGVAFVAGTTSSDGVPQAYFMRLDPNGAAVGSATRISAIGVASPVSDAEMVSLAWSGYSYLVAWSATAGGIDLNLYGTLINSAGVVFAHDVSLAKTTAHDAQPSVVWSSGAGTFVVAYADVPTASTAGTIMTVAVSLAGVVGTPATIVSAGSSTAPTLVDTGAGLGLAWEDSRDGGWDIYFNLITSDGQFRQGSDVRAATSGMDPLIVWTGAEFGVFFRDGRSGLMSTWFQRVSAGGSLAGSNYQVTYGTNVLFTGAAFGAHGYLVGSVPYGGAVAVQAYGCSYATTPGCPEGIDAYGITGTGATIAWLPSIDNSNDIAYYQVYRNDALVGKTSATSFSDTGLTAGSTYQYNVRAVNATQNVSSSCPSAQIYVKASSSVTLTATRAANDVDLAWNDAKQTAYRVFRGTSPQAMTEIGRTSSTAAVDANAAIGTVCYFYSVDTPQETLQ